MLQAYHDITTGPAALAVQSVMHGMTFRGTSAHPHTCACELPSVKGIWERLHAPAQCMFVPAYLGSLADAAKTCPNVVD